MGDEFEKTWQEADVTCHRYLAFVWWVWLQLLKMSIIIAFLPAKTGYLPNKKHECHSVIHPVVSLFTWMKSVNPTHW